MKLFLTAVSIAATALLVAQQPKPPQPKPAAAKSQAAKPAAAAKPAIDKPAIEAYVRHLMLYVASVNVTVSDPKPAPLDGFQEVTVRASLGNASEDRVFYISGDGQKIIQGNIYDLKSNPFKPDLDKLTTAGAPGMGTPGAPVVIVVFSDFQCPHCKDEAKVLRDNLLKTYPTQVRLYFKDFPLTQIHPWAKTASIIGRCLNRQNVDSFWAFHDWIFENQDKVTVENLKEKVAEQAKAKNWNSIQLEACMADPQAEREVEATLSQGRDLGVNGTPTMFINGRKIPYVMQWENLKQVIDFEVGYQQTARNAGEACCSVALPNPLNPSQPR